MKNEKWKMAIAQSRNRT